jgi:hypothetical protein
MLPLAPPLDPGREEARRWAWQELSDPVYARHERGLTERALLWVWRHLQDLELPAGPGGTGGFVILVALVLVVVLVVWFRAGPLRTAARAARQSVLHDTTLTAAQHRGLADQAASEGRWEEAVRERFRAVVRQLEERALLDELPGRTAQEVAADASRTLPPLARPLHEGARVFDDVCYGSRRATAQHDQRLRELDAQVSSAHPSGVLAGSST